MRGEKGIGTHSSFEVVLMYSISIEYQFFNLYDVVLREPFRFYSV